MEKVKVSRYITGKRPEYAPYSSDEEEEEEEIFPLKQQMMSPELEEPMNDGPVDDRRLRRLMEVRKRGRSDGEDDDEDEEEIRIAKHRRNVEVVDYKDDDDKRRTDGAEMSDEEEELNDEELQRKREILRRRALNLKEEKELMDIGEESSQEDEAQEESEYEECTDSEEEEENPRLKPVFVRKGDRITVQEKERLAQKEKDQEYEQRKLAQERRQETLRMVEAELKKDLEEKAKAMNTEETVETDDENEEEAYEAWKVRELKRLKRDREEREIHEREKQEVERLRNMTEEERRQELKMNPKLITNKSAKGKYKFLQKYYHRGVFYLDEEDTIFKRDYTAPTLEDHFNKTVLPKVMQVKNFGRSGRTKYTHLVDQDTTQFDSPWMSDTAMNLKFHTNRGGGMKQSFEGAKPKAV